MKPTPYPSNPSKPWRVSVPGRYFANRKRRAYYFAFKSEAQKFCLQVRRFGLPGITEQERTELVQKFGPLVENLVREAGGDPAKLVRAWDDYKQNKLSVKPGILSEFASEFIQTRKKKVSARTSAGDRFHLKKLVRVFGNDHLADISEADLRKFFDSLPGHTRSTYKTVKVFTKWAKQYGYLCLDPMAQIRPTEDWGSNRDIYPVSTFERMLRVAGGLEGPLPGELPTRAFLSLLPWFALSGFCGLRSCEAFPNAKIDEAIRWNDLYFDRGFIHIRPDVAKLTAKTDRERHIERPHALEALKAWLELVPKGIGFVSPIRERAIQKLKGEFRKATGIKFVENGFRNSFASYALSFDGEQGVGALAREMGNSEQVAKRYYIKTLEPRTGKAWFALRPQGPANIISMVA
jgi:integrase